MFWRREEGYMGSVWAGTLASFSAKFLCSIARDHATQQHCLLFADTWLRTCTDLSSPVHSSFVDKTDSQHRLIVSSSRENQNFHLSELPKWWCQDVRDWQWWLCREERKTDGFDIAADSNCLVSYAQFNAKEQSILARAINLFKSVLTVWLNFFYWSPLHKERCLERYYALH